MRCGWGPYFRRTFEVQAGNSPLQGQSKPPAKLVVLILRIDYDYIYVIMYLYIKYNSKAKAVSYGNHHQ